MHSFTLLALPPSWKLGEYLSFYSPRPSERGRGWGFHVLPSPSGELEGGFLGLTEPLLWIQLVAEGSLSKRRALGVAITRARYNFVEGSAFGLRRAKGSVKSKENPSKNEEKVLQKRRRTRTNKNIALRAGLSWFIWFFWLSWINQVNQVNQDNHCLKNLWLSEKSVVEQKHHTACWMKTAIIRWLTPS